MPDESKNRQENKQVRIIEISRIRIVPGWNPRAWREDDIGAMAESIEKVGQLSPILIRPDGLPWEESSNFDVIDGELRVRSILALGQTAIVVAIENVDADTAHDIAVAANLDRWPVYARFAEVARRKSEREDATEIAERTRMPPRFVDKAIQIATRLAPDLIRILRTSSNDATFRLLHKASFIGDEWPTDEMRWEAQRKWWMGEGWKPKRKTGYRKLPRMRVQLKADTIKKRCRVGGVKVSQHAADAMARVLLMTHGIIRGSKAK